MEEYILNRYGSGGEVVLWEIFIVDVINFV